MMTTIIGSGLELYIKRNARDEALNKIAEAERHANKLLQACAQRIQIMQRDILVNTEVRLAQNRRRLLAQADLHAKQILVMRREEVMQQVWQSVEQALRSKVAPDTRLELIAQGLVDAARQLGGGALVMQVNAQDQALLSPEQLARWQEQLVQEGVSALTLDEQAAPIWGGVMVRRLDVHQLVYNSWNERLALAQRNLRDQVYHWLTPPDPAAIVRDQA